MYSRPWLLRRLSLTGIVIVAASSINFWLPHLTGRNPIAERLSGIAAEGGGAADLSALIESYEQRFGLDKPLWEQYLNYLVDMVTFDWGYSIAAYPARVSDLVLQALPWTLGLMTVTLIIAFVIGSLLGAIAAWRNDLRLLQFVVPIFMLLAGIPYYLLGLMLIYFFAFRLGWFPIGGGAPLGAQAQWSWEYVSDILYHAALPGLSIVLAAIGMWALGMRAMIITVKGQDFILYAEAKGLKPWRIFYTYGFRNALLPQVTTLALAFGQLVTGAVLVEMVFGYPGLGSLLFNSVRYVDYSTVYGVVMVLIMTVALSMLIIDLLYPLLDPRVRAGR